MTIPANLAPETLNSGSSTLEPRDRSGDRWASQQAAAMAAAWERGEPVSAAGILDQYPDLDAEAAIRLIYEEVCLRREAGLKVDTAEVVRRYARWGDELQDLFDCDRLLGPSGAIAACPKVGETLGPFQLLAELGRGASGRTYLAIDPGLADRPVVLKVIPGDQDEHLALARLRHTHIVPLFSEHSFPELGLRVLCMPYLGGASLAQVLTDLANVPAACRSGQLLVERIDGGSRPLPASAPAVSPFRRSLEQASYEQAIAWITACLADALHYAHARGLVHMDIKPSNVLITVDGQPMLLDFHLARAPVRSGDWITDRLGGTPAWMSPEQQAAMRAVAESRPVPLAVDGRSDIFALGLLLRETLGAHGDSRGGLRGVSVGLQDIILKCLASDAADRYADAALLADDLRRHVNDLPLRGVANRSPIECWRKWRRRNPGALAWAIAAVAIAAAVAAALAVSLAAYGQRVSQLQLALEDARHQTKSGRYDAAIQTLEQSLKDTASLPAVGELRRAVREELRRAQGTRIVDELHNLADEIRFRYGGDLPAREDAQLLLRHCQTILDQRHDLMAGVGSAIEPALREGIKTDLLELVAVWSDLRVRLATADQAEDARRQALRGLQQADAEIGPSLALKLRCEALSGTAGKETKAAASTGVGRSVWEHYDLGRYQLRAAKIAAAAAEFQQALKMRPEDFWSNFYQGLCAFRLGQFSDAAAAFRTCAALAPRAAICRYNRALAYEALGQTDLAYDDYTQAITLDAELASARLNRGILCYRRGSKLEAIDDFEHGLQLPSVDRNTRALLHYNLALAHLARGDHVSAQADALEAMRLGCRDAASLHDDLRAERAIRLPQAVSGASALRSAGLK